jgi:hypothetical protein
MGFSTFKLVKGAFSSTLASAKGFSLAGDSWITDVLAL